MQLTDAQYKALDGGPIQIIAAPGVGNTIWITEAAFYWNFTAGGYSGVPQPLNLVYSGAAGQAILQSGTTSPTTGTAFGQGVPVTAHRYTVTVGNMPIMVSGNGAPTTGNGANTVDVWATYLILPAAA